MSRARMLLVFLVSVAMSLGVVGLGSAVATPQASEAEVLRAQKPRARVVLPQRLEAGRTLILRHRVRTNAKQPVTVEVTASHRKSGKRLSARDVQVLYKPSGRTWVWVSGRVAMKVRVSLFAPATAHFKEYRQSQVYRTTRMAGFDGQPELQGSGKGGPGKDAAKLLEWLVDAAASEVFGDVYSWAIGAIFGSEGKGTDLQPIMDQLNEIKAQLNVISEKIDELKKEIDFNACQAQTTAAARAVAVIQDANDQMINLVKSKEARPSVLNAWADQVLAVGGVGASLKEIHNVLAGIAGPTGSIGACAKAYRNDWKVPLGEADYYQRVWAYTSYFMRTELLAADLVIEAAHYKAALEYKAAKKPMPKPADIATICNNSSDSYCTRARQVARDLYYNMVKQAVLAGAAFSWNTSAGTGDKIVMAAQKDTPYVWITDLGSFQRRDTCVPSSVPDNPCGVTLTTWTSLQNPWWAGYKWGVASPNQWADLLSTRQNGDRRISEIMDSVGFAQGTTNKLIVYTDRYAVSSFDNPFMTWPGGRDRATKMPLAKVNNSTPEGRCMFDTNFIAYKSWNRWPICADGGNYFDALMNKYHRDGDRYYFDTSSFAVENGSNQKFYDGLLGGPIVHGDFWDRQTIYRKPGWLAPQGVGTLTKPGYVWPLLDTSDDTVYKCEPLKIGTEVYPLAKQNAGGAQTMCQADFANWIRSWIGNPPKS